MAAHEMNRDGVQTIDAPLNPSVKTAILVSGIANIIFGLVLGLLLCIGIFPLILGVIEIAYVLTYSDKSREKALNQATLLGAFEIVSGFFNAFISTACGIYVLIQTSNAKQRSPEVVQPTSISQPIDHTSPAVQREDESPVQTPQFLEPPVTREIPPRPVPPSISTPPRSPAGIDVNNANEEEIAALPGIGLILAKKAIMIRQSRGGFESIEQFGQALSLKPHILEKLRSRIEIGPHTTQAPGVVGQARGRVVDY